MATEEPWKSASQLGPNAASAGRPYHSADFAGYSASMLVASPPSQLQGPHLDALPRRGSLPSSLQPPARAPWREPDTAPWPQHSHHSAGKRPGSPAADPASPSAKRPRMSSHTSNETELRASNSMYSLPPRSSGEFQQGQHYARAKEAGPWASHAVERRREPAAERPDWGGRGNAPLAAGAGHEAARQPREPSQEPVRTAPLEELDIEAPEDSTEPFEMKAQKPVAAWSETVPTRVAHKVTKSFRVYSNAFIEGRISSHHPSQHIESEAPIDAAQEPEVATQPALPNVTVPHAQAKPWNGTAYEQPPSADQPGGLNASASRLSRSTGQDWQQPRQGTRTSPAAGQRDRSQEWARRQPEAAAKPPAGSAPDFEQWMADSRQQHLAEAGSLGVQGSSSDFLAAAQALQAQVEQLNPDLNPAQRDLLQQLVSGAGQSPSRAAAPGPRAPEGPRSPEGPFPETGGPPSLVRTGGMLGAPRNTTGSSFAAARVSSNGMAALRSSPQARPPTQQRIIVHGRGQGIGTSSDEAAQKAARDFVPEHEGGYIVRRSRYGEHRDPGWVDRSLPSMASSEMTAFPPLPRPVQPHHTNTMQSGPGTNSASFRQLPSPSQLEHRAADVPAVKPEEASAQPDGAVGQVIEGAGQLSEVARQLPVPLMQQVPGGDGLEAAAAAANKLATSMAPVSVRGADDRMAAETLISLISLGGEPAAVPTTTAMVPPPPRPPVAQGNSCSPPARPPSAQRARLPKRTEGMHPILGIAVPHARRTSLHPSVPGASPPAEVPLQTPAQPPSASPPPPVAKPPTPVASPSVTQSTEDDLPHIGVPLRKRSPSITSEREAAKAPAVQPAGKDNHAQSDTVSIRTDAAVQQ